MTPATAAAPDTLRDDAHAAQQELDALRAALELRLAALEAALASPIGSESLERLVLDLARTATDEAQAAARRACLQAQVEAEAEVTAVRVAAQKGVDVERAAGAEARASAKQMSTALEQERAAGVTLRRMLEEGRAALGKNQTALSDAHATLETERAIVAQVRQALDESERQRAALDRERIEARAAHDQLATELEQERSAAEALRLMLSEARAALEKTRDLTAAIEQERQAGHAARLMLGETRGALEKTHTALEDTHATLEAERAALQAARREIETLKGQLLESDRARKEADVRYEAVIADDVSILTDEVLEAGISDTDPGGEPMSHQPIRRANRYQLRENVQILVDSDPAHLVDVSTRGAQVLSTRTLRPNSIVKVRLPLGEDSIACRAKVVWAQLEPPSRSAALRYRAGLSFTNIDEAGIQQFVAQHGHHDRDV